MRRVEWSKEIIKLVAIIGIFLVATISYFIIPNKSYSSAILGISASGIGVIIFQLTRIISFFKNPNQYRREQIEIKDERTNLILSKSKSSSYEIETFVILAITFYAIYRDDVGFALAMFTLWLCRISFFFYYLSKNSKSF